ncbi:lipopolysaccharide biosynthesis protein [Virgibacillus sp. MG-45]|uniref:lipopolysaccharide biosynthesis protein n=1 Tax=Virgibacillus sp. MG-45 TaxID=3102791 RepID=UPI002EDB8B83
MLKRIMSNDFNKNVIKLMTGATIAQAIPIAISPILTRLYTPEDFGVLALFVAITAILGSVANARYDMAIVLPSDDKESINLVALSVLIATLISIMLTIILLVFHTSIIRLLDNPDIGNWLYFIPLVVFFIGLFNALNHLNTRMKSFGVIARVRVIKSVSLAAVQLGLGFLKYGVSGLIYGQIISHIFANTRLLKRVLEIKGWYSYIKLSEIIRLGKRYSDFPKYSLIATLSNNLAIHLTNIFIPILYSTKTLGHYSLVNRTLGLPTTMIGTSIGQVFLQKASEEKNKTGLVKDTFNSTFKKLILISLIPFTFLFFFSEELVSIIFGKDWIEAGLYMKYLLPLFFIRFIASPLSNILIVFERQKLLLYWQVGNLFISFIVFFVSYLNNLEVKSFFIFNTLCLLFHYLLLLFIVYRLSVYGAIKGVE